MSQELESPPLRTDLTTQACDTCRKRKVKCHLVRTESGVTARCGRCERLNRPCTFLMPAKVRGPKKRLAASGNSPHTPTSEHSVHSLQEGDVVPTPLRTYPTDDICERQLLKRIVQDYLEYMYPVIPIVHRPSFQRRFEEDRDCDDPGFLGLLIAMAANIVAAMPSRFSDYRSKCPPLPFCSRREMVWACYQKAMGLRTPDHFQQINFQKFATTYLFCAAFMQLGDHNWSRMLQSEAMQLARMLNLHKVSEYAGLNHVETQLRKKGFWLVFYAFIHGQLQNMFGERLSYLDPYQLLSLNPDDLMPVEVDDEFIFEDEIQTPYTSTPSLVTGLNLNSRVFWAAARNPRLKEPKDEPCPCSRARDPGIEITYIRDQLHTLKFLLDDIPPLLRPWMPMEGYIPTVSDTDRSRSGFATMRANLHVTHLWVQSLLLDQLEAAQSRYHSVQPTESEHEVAVMDPQTLWREREELCRQLFFVLHSLPQVNLEANGLHLAYKVRDIAASLLACPFHPDAPEAQRAAEYLQHSSNILARLDRSENMNTIHLQSWVDTDRLHRD